MKGEIINCSAHKDIYFLETNTKNESTDLANLFASPAGREMFKYKPRPKLKHKLNPALEFFIQNTAPASRTTSAQEDSTSTTNICEDHSSKSSTSTSTPNSTALETNRSRRSSIDLYEEAASILGLTCAQTDNCKCLECQCHYFDFEEEIDFPNGNDYVVDHGSSCVIQ